MSALEVALRIAIAVARHPGVQAFARHALRNATAEMLRQARHASRGGVRQMHIS